MESLQGIKVLVVDDDHDTLSVVGDLLTSRHAEVATAASGSQALALLSSFVPDVIVSDINMPDVDGYQLLRMIRARSSTMSTPIGGIALTGNREMRDHARALLTGYSVHLSKPVDAAALCAAVKRVATERAK